MTPVVTLTRLDRTIRCTPRYILQEDTGEVDYSSLFVAT